RLPSPRSPTVPSPLPLSKVMNVFNSEHPNLISSSCLLSWTNPNSTPPPSIPRNLNSSQIPFSSEVELKKMVEEAVEAMGKEKEAKKMTEKEDLGCNFDGLNDQIITPLRLKLTADIYEKVTERVE
ncbi:unnamed protein product, partial [Brassica oleracea]